MFTLKIPFSCVCMCIYLNVASIHVLFQTAPIPVQNLPPENVKGTRRNWTLKLIFVPKPIDKPVKRSLIYTFHLVSL